MWTNKGYGSTSSQTMYLLFWFYTIPDTGNLRSWTTHLNGHLSTIERNFFTWMHSGSTPCHWPSFPHFLVSRLLAYHRRRCNTFKLSRNHCRCSGHSPKDFHHTVGNRTLIGLLSHYCCLYSSENVIQEFKEVVHLHRTQLSV